LFQVLPSGLVDFVPDNDHVGTHSIAVTVTDAYGVSHSLDWELVVNNVNQGPTLLFIEEQLWREDEPVLLTVVATDPDVGDVLTFSDSTSMFDIEPRTGVINFTPTQGMVGDHQVRIKVQDMEGLYDEIYFAVSVLSDNDPPTASIRAVQMGKRLKEGDMLSLAAEVEDEDNDIRDLHLSWFFNGENMGNENSLTLRNLRPGNHTVELRVEDGDNVVSATYDFSVEDVEETFPWGTLLTALVVLIIIVVVVLKVVLPLFKWGGPAEEASEPEPSRGEPDDPFGDEDSEENPFHDWSP
jgi:hypothetical protein